MSDLFAKHLTGMTLVGARSDTYPYKSGNCFSVEATDGKEYKIVNFVAENFEALHKFGCPAPIRIKVLSGRTAVIHDERIPANWYRRDFCEACTPDSLLPMPQKLAHERLEACGAEKRSGSVITCVYSLAPQWPETPVNRRKNVFDRPPPKSRVTVKKSEFAWKASDVMIGISPDEVK